VYPPMWRPPDAEVGYCESRYFADSNFDMERAIRIGAYLGLLPASMLDCARDSLRQVCRKKVFQPGGGR
jgi:hypothetical protein